MLNFFIKETSESIDSVMEKLKISVENNWFKIVHIHDMKDTFSKNNLEFASYFIVDICNPSSAHKALSLDKRLWNFMPKSILVYEENVKTVLNFMYPDKENMKLIFPEELAEISKNTITTMENIINEILI